MEEGNTKSEKREWESLWATIEDVERDLNPTEEYLSGWAAFINGVFAAQESEEVKP